MTFSPYLLAIGCVFALSLCLACDHKSEKTTVLEPTTAASQAVTSLAEGAPAPEKKDLIQSKEAEKDDIPSAAPTDASRLEAVQKRYAEVTSKNSLIMRSHSFECVGGEVNAKLVRYFEADQLAQANIQIDFAGHASEQYQFIYQGKELVFALANETVWSFSSGAPGENTEDTITQQRYYFADGEPFRCLKKKAKGPTKQIDKLLEQAPNEKDDCSLADKLKKLGDGMLTDEKEPAAVKQVLCKI